MLQTLFIIPNAWFEGPLLLGWIIFGLGLLIVSFLRKGASAATGQIPFLLVGATLIWFVLPGMQVMGVNPADPAGELIKVGLAVRGYGLFLLLAIVSGVAITLYRAKQVAVSADQILSLAFWMILCGLIGARLFYVLQKHNEFFVGSSFKDNLVSMVDMTKGGMVVYGSLIGGVLAAFVFFRVTRLPVLRTADLIAPGMVLGLAIGRIGCLMNGCCFGGLCDVEGIPQLHFPAGSPPYMQQLDNGQLLGLKLSENSEKGALYRWNVDSMATGSLAERYGIKPGDQITIYPVDDLRLRFLKSVNEQTSQNFDIPVHIINAQRDIETISGKELPARSLGIHPTQIYSSIDAFLLCLILWFYWHLRSADGQVFALMLIFHGVARFLLEIVRQDELGVFGTELTISQWISIGLLISGIVLFGYASGTARARSEKYRKKSNVATAETTS